MTRALALTLALSVVLAGSSARAQCQTSTSLDGGSVGSSCPPIFTLSVPGLPGTTTAPLLEIDAIIQDTGAVMVKSPQSMVFVTVTGSGADGGGTLVLPDGGTDPSFAGQPFVAALSLTGFVTDGGVFTSTWDGNTSLFAGVNTIVVSALQPSGLRLDSAPQFVTLVVGSGGSADGGSSGGTQDGGVVYGADGGVLTQPLRTVIAGESAQGCSTTAGGPPSFLLMALAVMLVGLGRRALDR